MMPAVKTSAAVAVSGSGLCQGDGRVSATVAELVRHYMPNEGGVDSAPTYSKLSFRPLSFPLSILFINSKNAYLIYPMLSPSSLPIFIIWSNNYGSAR